MGHFRVGEYKTHIYNATVVIAGVCPSVRVTCYLLLFSDALLEIVEGSVFDGHQPLLLGNSVRVIHFLSRAMTFAENSLENKGRKID